MVGPDKVLEFWLDRVGPKGWYNSDAALDAEIRETFLSTWEASREGKLDHWLSYPSGVLAYLIVTDQLSRNMFRDSGDAFATDAAALAIAKRAICKGWDMKIDEPTRQFFYLPLMHSENLCDQDRCIRLMVERLPETGQSNLLHAQAHREVIRQFGRFPYRNAALGRLETRAEKNYAAQGGYGFTLRQLQMDLAA
ncbi:DUF924 family protein [Sulfitobacter donghicola]|uniref:Transmembrane protein n=1 Tax=Sulfitobacter donghicola DSW-25 = KCTC 12864 = JCM 14565 TaxID=1300350 RepID=A0A073IIS9_9RHOB|nr:DUF924 family protein [Sulfitobacter donghicola]KEJ90233.1 hypothetical protein DSW25_08545 [Sulfitobacter donghicola DSW-25 = KCTC 12864 = JCM 14565]KIN66599.1 hypothetical protein Z948_299 [Sulfitobacter donghicola DSW-25 = KCTC 12864 = JCM 14565]